MYRKKFRPQPVSTHGLEEDLDRSYASLQSQVDILEKLQKIFGENPTDPVIAFQLRKIKEGLTRDVRKLALTGTDLHQLQEQFGADVVRGQIINARQIINQEKEGHNGQLTDMINDEQIGNVYQRQQLRLDPLEKAKLAEHVQANIWGDNSRQELAQFYVNKGMRPDQADKKATQQFLKHGISDQDQALLELIKTGASKLSDEQLQKLLNKVERNNPEEPVQGEEAPVDDEEEKVPAEGQEAPAEEEEKTLVQMLRDLTGKRKDQALKEARMSFLRSDKASQAARRIAGVIKMKKAQAEVERLRREIEDLEEEEEKEEEPLVEKQEEDKQQKNEPLEFANQKEQQLMLEVKEKLDKRELVAQGGWDDRNPDKIKGHLGAKTAVGLLKLQLPSPDEDQDASVNSLEDYKKFIIQTGPETTLSMLFDLMKPKGTTKTRKEKIQILINYTNRLVYEPVKQKGQ